eukprot:jgi/Undpi1/12448/HiC_scaffold_5.g02119.m1
MGNRARMMGFDVLDAIDNIKHFSDLEAHVRQNFFPHRRYLSLGVLPAVAEALKATIVVWNRRRRYHEENTRKQALFKNMMDGAAPRQTGGDGDKKPGLVSKPVDTTKGGMWANIDAAKAGDPRLPSVNNPYATDRPEERPAALLYPEGVTWVPFGTVGGDLPSACRASAANKHVPGIEGYTERSSRIKDERQEYAFCSSHSSEKGREEWVFDDIGHLLPVIACLTPPERRATALLRMRCCMFKGGGGVGSDYTIFKGAAEYVPADFDGSVGNIAIDPTKTKDVRPEEVNAAVQWLAQNNHLVAKYLTVCFFFFFFFLSSGGWGKIKLTVWNTHKDKLSQPSRDQKDNSIPAGFPTTHALRTQPAIPTPTSKAWCCLRDETNLFRRHTTVPWACKTSSREIYCSGFRAALALAARER